MQVVKNNKRYVIEDFSREQEALLLHETIFHNANGYLGVRGNFEEGYPQGYRSIRGEYINGFYDFAQMKQAEKLCGLVEEKQTMLNVADTQTIKLWVNGEVFSMFEGEVSSSKRWLDMEKGVTGRELIWKSPKGMEVGIRIQRMASFAQLSLFTIEYEVEALNFSGSVEWESIHEGEVQNYCNPDDPRVAGESEQHLLVQHREMDKNAVYIVADTAKSGLSVCSGTAHQLSGDGTVDTSFADGKGVTRVQAEVKEGNRVTLVKYTVLTDSIREADCLEAAKREMKQAFNYTMEDWYEKQAEYLREYWKHCDISIDGDEELNEALSYNLYQLIQSAGKDPHGNIAAKGLSGEGYEGHFFWDTEMYLQPFFTLTKPEITKNLITFRYTILDAARENARILGHQKGALYPWRTIMGKECSGYFPSGSAQYHINGDIAYSIIAYYLATKDLDFMREMGAEILFETARLWMDAGNFCKEHFYINDVTGPDEYTCLVNNNYYTNALAQYHLKWAGHFYQIFEGEGAPVIEKIGLTREEAEEFRKASDQMYLAYEEELGINPQDDSFLHKKRWDIANTPKENFPLLLHYHPLYLYRYQVCKQADTVLAHFILEDAQSLETIRNSFLYYEGITTHDSSLSTCIFSIVASKLGMQDKAYEYFGDSAKLDLFNTHHNTMDGIHTANMGGNYMAIVYGFAGLRLKESGLYLHPQLPKQWNRYEFCITYEGSGIRVNVEADAVVLTLEEGEAKELHVYGETYLLEQKLTISRQAE